MQPLPESSIIPRLMLRAKLLGQDSSEQSYWRDLFDHARVLGQLLHTARQQLDTWQHTAPIDETTLRMWEWGLALPDEIASGDVTRMTRWYIDRLREQRAVSPTTTLAHDSIALVTELTQSSLSVPSLEEEESE
jgi:hypothetical protein